MLVRRSRRVERFTSIGVDLLYQIAIAVVNKLGGLSANSDRDQAIFPFGDASQSASKASRGAVTTFG